MNTNELANLIFPGVQETPGDLEAKYPPRPTGQIVTRFAPSPTGYLHIGGLLAALVEERYAHQRGGVFFLRIEDTDKKREVENGVRDMIEAFKGFQIEFDEGPLDETEERGAYGPYIQSKREGIYCVFLKELLRQGKAYPCFLSEEELSAMKTEQEKRGVKTGCYGEWARHRSLSGDEVTRRMAGEKFVIRLRSSGSDAKRIRFTDGIRGEIEMPENDFDIVIMKTDGLPTYHFAHAVDDHLMRTTHVIRGEEWLSSVPLHLELFLALGFTPPSYAHISPIMKEDGPSRRKLSKRHDPEAAVHFYQEAGYPVAAVIEYLMNFIDSGFEQWRTANPAAPAIDYPVDISRMSASGGLFDMQKLSAVSQDVIARMTAEEVYSHAVAWASTYAPAYASVLAEKKDFMLAVFASGRGGPKSRKDISAWKDIPALYDYLLSDTIALTDAMKVELIKEETKRLLTFVVARVSDAPVIDAAFVALLLKDAQKETGAKGKLLYHPIRYALTARDNGLDLDAIFVLLGKDRALTRLRAALAL